MSSKGFIYILQSDSSGRFYVGSSADPGRRLFEHNHHKTKSTKGRGPWRIVFTQEFANTQEAKRVEKRIKKLKRRDYIKKIIQDGILRMQIP